MNEIPRLFIAGPCGKAVYMSVPDFHKAGITTIESDGLSVENGGNGLIRAVTAKRLGATVSLLSVLPEHSHAAKSCLSSEGVTLLPIPLPDFKEYFKVVTVDGYMDVRETVYRGSDFKIDMRDMLSYEETIRCCNGVLLDSSIKSDALYMTLEIAKRSDAVSVFTPTADSALDREILSKPYLLVLDEFSAQKLLATPQSTKSSDMAFALMRNGIKRAVILHGKNSVMLFENDEIKSMHLYPSRPILSAGTADVFAAALTVYMCKGFSLSAAAQYAASAVSINNQKDTVLEALPYKEQVKVKFI